MSGGPRPAEAAPPPAGEERSLVPKRSAALVFASLAIGQILAFVSLSLVSAYLGLDQFGRFGLCMVDFAVAANIGNFALPAASIPFVIRGGMGSRTFSVVMHARLWTTLLALAGYLLFESAVRSDPELLKAHFALAAAVAFNPSQLEWWSQARRAYAGMFAGRVIGGLATLALVLTWVRAEPGLASAGGAYAAGMAAAFLCLAWSARGTRLQWVRPGAKGMAGLWRGSWMLALTSLFDLLFVPLGYYAFRFFEGTGPFLGAYGTAYRISSAAALFASTLYIVLLPRFSRPAADSAGSLADDRSLGRLFDKMLATLAAALVLAPPLARPALRLLFPATDWSPETLAFGSWTLSCMAASTCLHLLRMPPLTKALADGKQVLFSAMFFLSGAANLLSVAAGGHLAGARWIPVFALAADFAFTGFWCVHVRRHDPRAALLRLMALGLGLSAYLAWAGVFR
jgi:O-antigen/teichoic acid export membrane protein